jgi:hypothetical protein
MKDSEARIYHRQSKRFIKDKKESKDRIWMSKSNKSSCQLRVKKQHRKVLLIYQKTKPSTSCRRIKSRKNFAATNSKSCPSAQGRVEEQQQEFSKCCCSSRQTKKHKIKNTSEFCTL